MLVSSQKKRKYIVIAEITNFEIVQLIAFGGLDVRGLIVNVRTINIVIQYVNYY